MMDFDLQLFGGGGESSTTSREIPDQSAEERALQNYLMQYSTGMGELSKEMIMRAYDALGNTYTPNWESVINDYTNRNNEAFNTYENWSLDRQNEYQDKLDSYNDYYKNKSDSYFDWMYDRSRDYEWNMRNALNQYNEATGIYDNLMTDALGQYNEATSIYDNLMTDALGQYNRETNAYDKRMADALTQYNNSSRQYDQSMQNALADYNRGMNGITDKFGDLINGVLPSAYAQNRQAALNADLKGTVGSSINNLANRGVINSSVTNKALDDISQSASDTLAKRYADDLSLEASLLGQQGQNYQNVYGTKASNAGNIMNNAGQLYGNSTANAGSRLDAQNQLYGNRTGNAGNRLDAQNQLYGNKTSNLGNIYETQRGLYQDGMQNLGNLYNVYANSADKVYNAQSDFANNWIQNNYAGNQANLQGLYQGQTASFEPGNQYLNYAGDLSTAAQNLFNTMYSGRMGTGSTTTTKSDGGSGMWSAVGGLGTALIACFTGDTLVTTTDGYKYIKDIQLGDVVLSVRDGKITPKVVTHVNEPTMQKIVKVIFSNGTVWHTTENQRFFDGRHFHYLEDDGNRPALVHGGTPSYVIAVEAEGRSELVYDFAVEGHRGENVFFANDVAAEGMGD